VSSKNGKIVLIVSKGKNPANKPTPKPPPSEEPTGGGGGGGGEVPTSTP
jgi:hypothetical protein